MAFDRTAVQSWVLELDDDDSTALQCHLADAHEQQQQQEEQQQHDDHYHHHHQLHHHHHHHIDCDESEPPPEDFYAIHTPSVRSHEHQQHQQEQEHEEDHQHAPAMSTRPRTTSTTSGQRSASTSALTSAPTASRASPAVSNKVRAIAEQINQRERSVSGGGGRPATTTTPVARRSQSKEPARTRAGAYDAARRARTSISSTASTASAARPAKEASYGSYKFNNLKPRERPQPAPASPRHTHRANGSRASRGGSIDQHTTHARSQMASPVRRPASGGRQPLFGEVGALQLEGPGFGIPTFDSTLGDGADGLHVAATSSSSPHHKQAVTPATPTFGAHEQTANPPEHAKSHRRRSPQSRIPVAARRLSATSDSSSSTRSVKYTPTRLTPHSNRASPTRTSRRPILTGAVVGRRSVDQSTLPTLAYRAYREQEKTTAAVGTRGGPSVPAVVTAPPPPTSPRLRNSRERQPLQSSPSPGSRSSAPHGEQGYFPTGAGFDSIQDAGLNSEQPPLTNHNMDGRGRFMDTYDSHDSSDLPRLPSPQQRLSLQTSRLPHSSPPEPASAFTEFEESPVLGIPGSFLMTPPIIHQKSEEKSPQQTVYHGAVQEMGYQSPGLEQSELDVRASIPIMLSEKHASQPSEHTSELLDEVLKPMGFEHEPEDNTAAYDRDDSSMKAPHNRETLYPDDSASVAPYRAVGSLAFDRETYSVVNSVLNLYHQSQVVSPELASLSKERVQRVSPVVAQHKDWGSKEATETYLARLLSDANASSDDLGKPQTSQIDGPSQDPHPNTQDISEVESGGTAIIYPSESRRYSRGSRGSTATTIQENASHSGSSSGNPSKESLVQHSTLDPQPESATNIELPQLAWTHEGLGLSLQDSLSHSPPTQYTPPRPAYSPPPPPVQPSVEQRFASSSLRPSPPALTSDAQFEMHPARARTPIIHTQEQSLEDRYGTPQPVEATSLIPTGVEKEQSGPIDPAKQALVRRYRILEELLTTEHQFCIDMMIAHNIFEATAPNLMSEKEKKLLFSNCKELEKFSLSLFRSFKRAARPVVNYEIPPPTGPWNRDPSDTRPYNPPESSLTLRRPSEDAENQFENCTLENDRLTTIGQVFLDNKEKMERLYTTYFLNQDNASAYIKKNQHNPDLSGWVVACFEQVENMTQAWDLDSLLLKPCQRLLKYPLLLEGLANASDPDHPDLQNILDARKELLAINARINEAKARSDTFRAAASEGKKEKSRGKGLGKTFVKAFIPKVDKSKAYDEADKAFKDQEYKSREQKFGGHFFQLQIVIRDFEQYLESITEHYLQLNIVFLGFITVCEVAPSIYPEIESTWRKWAMAHFELQNKALEDHKAAVRSRVLKPVGDLWEMWVSYQKTIEQRKKYLLYYVKHKQLIDRGEKVDPELEDSAKKFIAINDTLKHELPLLYERTKGLMRSLMTLFMCLQKDWYKTCSKKILPLLESEPQHTTSLRYDMDSYVERFHADYKPMQDLANRLGIINRSLLVDISNMTSPVPTMSSDGDSSRNSSSRRTESIGSEASMLDGRHRNSGGYTHRPHARNPDPPRSTPTGPAYPSLHQTASTGRPGPGPTSLREARALSPISDNSDATVMHSGERRNTGPSSRNNNYYLLDGVVEDDRLPFGSGAFDFPPQLGASFLSPTTQTTSHSRSVPMSQSTSLPGSTRTSGIFNSALPMSDSPIRGSVEELPTTPADTDEPEVLFLAASLFEFNIAHDRREGGIPYLVYVPGEIFDVIGMKGELWLARNQDDASKTVGWIWEKHFARILPEDA
ncbi:hypothetical protein LEMA_P064120.1 [Plenodomus lingam JN3]|uniref:DH domain-containing protein n=1 Tax=Leptosphaeria maculans (strain JN3 / isolate v23.1.3 / race Av1-4-5-6-7-8) TaxID=985895 RepID=E4ZG66_LEPMJ|nr:hypothetical protein LEMA_P064120.1 [Plenodomus lingam JN3]CBX90286.1 hypothetical protein LEMA_P064120.1 [Plenodomus lingam JN3]